MRKLLFVLALAPTVMVACHRGSKKNPVAAASEAVKDLDLQKTWESQCSAERTVALVTGAATGLQAPVKSSRVQIKFAGNAATLTTIYYSQADCVQDAWIFEESGNFKIDKDKKSNDGGTHIDFDFREVTARVIDQTGAQAASAINMCGKNNWAANSKKETVTKAAKDLTCYGIDVPRKVPTIYRIDGDSLVLGTPPKATGERPATLSFNIRYHRK